MKRDLSDRIFGKLIVIDKEGDKWYCLCECGGFIRTTTEELLHRKITHCGCVREERKILANHTGKKFGKLTALFPSGEWRGCNIWVYQCECGNYRKSAHSYIVRYKDSSCGCGTKGPGRRPVDVYEHIEEVCRIYYDGKTKGLDREDFRKIDRSRPRKRSKI